MEIVLTPEQSDFVRDAVASGRVDDPEHAVHQALEQWVERERRRVELLASLDAAELSIADGGGLPISPEAMATLAKDVMARCAERYRAERTNRR